MRCRDIKVQERPLEDSTRNTFIELHLLIMAPSLSTLLSAVALVASAQALTYDYVIIGYVKFADLRELGSSDILSRARLLVPSTMNVPNRIPVPERVVWSLPTV